jgi:hypothetical protein
MGCTYVKEFDFKKSAGDMSAKKSGYCGGGMVKKTGYAQGGTVGKEAAKVAVHKHEKSMHKGEPMTKLAKGGPVKERATGEVYPSKRAMVKHEKMETPREQREELIQRTAVRAPARRSVPVAPRGPLIPTPVALKAGGPARKPAKC